MTSCKSSRTCSVNGCTNSVKARGWCNKHWLRWRRTGSPTGSLRITLEERFEANVDRSGDCHLWTGALHKGYGIMSVGGRDPSGSMELAHRIAWRLVTGESPPLHVLHTCDTPPCVRFEHLFSGTQAENMRDMAEKRRSGVMKLDDAQTRKIRNATGTHKSIAEEFGIHRSTVGKIKNGTLRKYVD